MIRHDDERLLTVFLRDAAPPAPSDLGADIRAVVGVTRQRPRWSARLYTDGSVVGPRLAWPASVPLVVLLATLLAALLAVAVLGALLRQAPVRNGALAYSAWDPPFGAEAIYVRDQPEASPRVIGRGTCPVFLPDGQLMWNSGEGPRGLPTVVAAADGTGVRELPPLIDAIDRSVSPDGRQVAWLRQVAEYVDDAGSGGRIPVVELWVGPFDGGPGRRLSTGAPGTIAWAHSPAWSPDGRLIAFGTSDDPRELRSALPARTSVRVIEPDGSNERTVSERRGLTFGRLAWSPDSRYLAYRAEVDDSRPFLESADEAEMYVADIATGVETAVTSGHQGGEGAAWSPDGRSLAYVGPRNELRIIEMAGGTAIASPRTDPIDRTVFHVGWSPDGEWLTALEGDVRDGGAWTLLLLHSSLRGPDIVLEEGVDCLPSWEGTVR